MQSFMTFGIPSSPVWWQRNSKLEGPIMLVVKPWPECITTKQDRSPTRNISFSSSNKTQPASSLRERFLSCFNAAVGLPSLLRDQKLMSSLNRLFAEISRCLFQKWRLVTTMPAPILLTMADVLFWTRSHCLLCRIGSMCGKYSRLSTL